MSEPDRPPPIESAASPPPLPAQKPTVSYHSASPAREPDRYQKVADTVGFVPTLRLSDNLIQLAAAVVGAALGVIIVRGLGHPQLSIVGAIVGLLLGVLAIGAVLMVLGLIRRGR